MDAPSDRNSLIWIEGELEYVKALLRWERAARTDAPKGGSRLIDSARSKSTNGRPVAEFRLLVVGPEGGGKTALLTRLRDGSFSPDGQSHDQYYEQACRCHVQIDGETYALDALELPGRCLQHNSDLIRQGVHITEAALVVYDLTSADSLRQARQLRDVLRQAAGEARAYGITLVGNKADRCPSRRGAEGAGGETGLVVVEVSARTGEGVALLSAQAGREILASRRANSSARRGEQEAQGAVAGTRPGGGGEDKEEEEEEEVKRTGFWRRFGTRFRRGGGAALG